MAGSQTGREVTFDGWDQTQGTRGNPSTFGPGGRPRSARIRPLCRFPSRCSAHVREPGRDNTYRTGRRRIYDRRRHRVASVYGRLRRRTAASCRRHRGLGGPRRVAWEYMLTGGNWQPLPALFEFGPVLTGSASMR